MLAAAMRWLLVVCVELMLWMHPFFLPALQWSERQVMWVLECADGVIGAYALYTWPKQQLLVVLANFLEVFKSSRAARAGAGNGRTRRFTCFQMLCGSFLVLQFWTSLAAWTAARMAFLIACAWYAEVFAVCYSAGLFGLACASIKWAWSKLFPPPEPSITTAAAAVTLPDTFFPDPVTTPSRASTTPSPTSTTTPAPAFNATNSDAAAPAEARITEAPITSLVAINPAAGCAEAINSPKSPFALLALAFPNNPGANAETIKPRKSLITLLELESAAKSPTTSALESVFTLEANAETVKPRKSSTTLLALESAVTPAEEDAGEEESEEGAAAAGDEEEGDADKPRKSALILELEARLAQRGGELMSARSTPIDVELRMRKQEFKVNTFSFGVTLKPVSVNRTHLPAVGHIGTPTHKPLLRRDSCSPVTSSGGGSSPVCNRRSSSDGGSSSGGGSSPVFKRSSSSGGSSSPVTSHGGSSGGGSSPVTSHGGSSTNTSCPSPAPCSPKGPCAMQDLVA